MNILATHHSLNELRDLLGVRISRKTVNLIIDKSYYQVGYGVSICMLYLIDGTLVSAAYGDANLGNDNEELKKQAYEKTIRKIFKIIQGKNDE